MTQGCRGFQASLLRRSIRLVREIVVSKMGQGHVLARLEREGFVARLRSMRSQLWALKDFGI